MTDATNGLFRRLRGATSRTPLASAPLPTRDCRNSSDAGERDPLTLAQPWLRAGSGLWADDIVEPVWVLELELDSQD